MKNTKWKFIMALSLVLVAMALPASAAGSKVSQSEPDAKVKGLWLKCPSFPKDATVIEFSEDTAPWDDSLSDVSYTRSVDSLLFFEIRRQTIEESELQNPDDVASLIEMRVNNDEVDEDSIEANMKTIDVNTDASDFAALYSYPCATAEYRTGANEDTRQNAALFIFTDVYCFVVEASVAADWAEDYEENILGWFKGLKFVN